MTTTSVFMLPCESESATVTAWLIGRLTDRKTSQEASARPRLVAKLRNKIAVWASRWPFLELVQLFLQVDEVLVEIRLLALLREAPDLLLELILQLAHRADAGQYVFRQDAAAFDPCRGIPGDQLVVVAEGLLQVFDLRGVEARVALGGDEMAQDLIA